MLEGKTAVITGALQGIGRATVRMFAENGADIFACAYMKTEEYEDFLSNTAAETGAEIIPVYFDMADNESVKRATREIQKAKRPVNALINIAGVTMDAFFPMVTEDQMKDTFQINFSSQIVFTQYITKLMLRSGGVAWSLLRAYRVLTEMPGSLPTEPQRPRSSQRQRRWQKNSGRRTYG